MLVASLDTSAQRRRQLIQSRLVFRVGGTHVQRHTGGSHLYDCVITVCFCRTANDALFVGNVSKNPLCAVVGVQVKAETFSACLCIFFFFRNWLRNNWQCLTRNRCLYGIMSFEEKFEALF